MVDGKPDVFHATMVDGKPDVIMVDGKPDVFHAIMVDGKPSLPLRLLALCLWRLGFLLARRWFV